MVTWIALERADRCVNMATYANTTNPFIRTDSAGNLVDRTKQKKAPGMAKPQSVCSNRQEVNLLLSNDNSLQAFDASEKPSDDSKQESSAKNEQYAIDLSSCVDLDVLGATENLVDSVIRLELEEQDAAGKDQDEENTLTEVELNDNEERHKDGENKKKQEDVDDDDDDDNDDFYAETGVDSEQLPMEQVSRQHQHIELIKKLRLQLRDLERYAYERGELGEEVPPSVVAERQTVILDTLKEKLSLNISSDEIGKLELAELKSQVDKEIHDLINPMITKEHLLSQLKTQLTDLERYIAHLHGTIGKNSDKRGCSCLLHGCSSPRANNNSIPHSPSGFFKNSSLMHNEALPKTSKLIRSLVTQLICSDIKLQESAKKEEAMQKFNEVQPSNNNNNNGTAIKKQPHNDEAAWTLHIDKVILARDSLVNIFTLEPQYQKSSDKTVDERLIESIVRRQLVPALRDLLSYGLIDPAAIPSSVSYASILFNPYYLLSTLTCFPTSQKTSTQAENYASNEKIHVWNVIEDYYNSRNEPEFKSSSIKTLSQSFDLAPSISGPIKITSKQALLIAVDDIIETLSKCKPNGPESHFRAFIYTALNRSKLSTWIRLIFKNKSVIKRFYHSYSFVCQSDKMDKLLATIEAINQFEFKLLRTDVESIEQFVNAF